MESVIHRNVPEPTEWLERLGRPYMDIQGDFHYYAEHIQELTKEYPDQWVAIIDQAVIANEKELSELLKNLQAQGIQKTAAVIKFLPTKRMNLIL